MRQEAGIRENRIALRARCVRYDGCAALPAPLGKGTLHAPVASPGRWPLRKAEQQRDRTIDLVHSPHHASLQSGDPECILRPFE